MYQKPVNSKIMCMDMDSFFASVEQASRPDLRDQPIAVAGAGERSVLLSASYQARKFGVKAGKPVWEALQKCPNLKIVHASNQKYVYVSQCIAAYLQSILPKAKMYSIDEAFIDITDYKYDVYSLALQIQNWLKDNYMVTGSIGVGPSHVIAKMASDVRKPDGYFEVCEEDVLSFIDGFKFHDIWGIGRKTSDKLRKMGFSSPKDVRNAGIDKMYQAMGLSGKYIYLACCGKDKDYEIIPDAPLKSVGHSITAPKDILTEDIAYAYLLQLSEMVSSRARRQFISGKVITLVVRESGMKTYSFRHSIGFFTSATHHIYQTVKELYDTNIKKGTAVRLLGVSLGDLSHGGAVLNNIEDYMSGQGTKLNALYSAIDSVNTKHAKGLIFGSALKINYRKPQVIAPSFRTDKDNSQYELD